MFTGRTIPSAVIDCIAHAREPGVRDLCAVADHIRSDLRGRPAGAARPATISEAAARRLSMRAAHVALTGCA